jgi:addiction module HigA family antidote
MARKLAPMHPGEVLREEFLLPLNLSAGALAKACGLPRTRIERIAAETTGISADTALRLGKALGTSAQLWMNPEPIRCGNRQARDRREAR